MPVWRAARGARALRRGRAQDSSQAYAALLRKTLQLDGASPGCSPLTSPNRGPGADGDGSLLRAGSGGCAPRRRAAAGTPKAARTRANWPERSPRLTAPRLTAPPRAARAPARLRASPAPRQVALEKRVLLREQRRGRGCSRRVALCALPRPRRQPAGRLRAGKQARAQDCALAVQGAPRVARQCAHAALGALWACVLTRAAPSHGRCWTRRNWRMTST
jgi:hypothetical protein